MHVTLSGTGPLKRVVSEGGLLLDLPAGASLRDALSLASEQLGDAGSVLRDHAGQVQPGVVVFVNDEMVRRTSADTQLNDGDELTVLMPVAGGC